MSRKISRRSFLASGVAVTAASVLTGCSPPRRWVTLEPYVTPPEDQPTGTATWYASTCRLCPAGCGIIVRVMNGRAVKIEGNPEHPLNRGKLCAQGQAGLQWLYNPDRLQGAMQQTQRGSRQFQKADPDASLTALSAKLQAAGARVAIWTGANTSGHLFDLFGRFAAAVGAPAPVVFDLTGLVNGNAIVGGASVPLFGRNDLPYYPLGEADVVYSFGADFLVSGASPVRYSIEYGAFRSQAAGKRGYLVTLDPRQSNTAAMSDRWVAIRPGSEGLVAQGIARLIADQGLGGAERAGRARLIAGSADLNAIAQASDVSTSALLDLAVRFTGAVRPLAIPGGHLTGQDNGVAAAAAVQALNFIAGTLGQAGGLSMSAAAPSPAVVRPAAASYADVQRAIDRLRSGQVQVLLVHDANPVYELPPAAGFVEALAKTPTVVSFSSLIDETAAQADLILPDRTYLESWGYSVVAPDFGLPAVSAQQPVVSPYFDLPSAGDVLLAVAKKVPAAAALKWADEVAFLKEVVQQLPAGANVAAGAGADMQWARFLQHGGWWPVQAPISAPVQAASIRMPAAADVPAARFQGDPAQFPYYLYLYPTAMLGTGRGAHLPWLQGSPDTMTSICWESWVEIHPATARKLGLKKGDIVIVSTPQGQVEAPVYLYPAIRPDTIALPFGQGHADLGRYASGRGANLLQLVGSQLDASGNHLAWAAQRAQISRTGRWLEMATFEWTEGVEQGFPNKGFPGD